MKQPLSTAFLVSLGRLLKTLAHVYWKVPASLGTVSCRASDDLDLSGLGRTASVADKLASQ